MKVRICRLRTLRLAHVRPSEVVCMPTVMQALNCPAHLNGPMLSKAFPEARQSTESFDSRAAEASEQAQL